MSGSLAPAPDLAAVFAVQRAAFARDPFPSLRARRERLDRLVRAIENHQDAIATAIDRDFGGRSRDESILLDCLIPIRQARAARRQLSRWMMPRRASTGLLLAPAKAQVQLQPKGVVAIISAWNYPVQLALGPLIPALAAGNRVMLKMPENTPRAATALRKCLASAFDEDLVAVIEGGPEEGAALTRLPFDHILFTGSTRVGRLVMGAAAENLAPVTLELGGKSPVLVDRDCPLDLAAERITFCKSLNAGQTCIAPDYVLVPEGSEKALAEACIGQFQRLYPDFAANPDYTSLASDRQATRMDELLADARGKGAQVLAAGPPREPGERRMALHCIVQASEEMQMMREEIFGPLLPILAYESLDQALEFINRRPRPLALYYFGFDAGRQRRISRETIAGGMCINDCGLQFMVEDAPFGGIGPSGMGQYHGFDGFREFSKAKTIVTKGRLNTARFSYPPYRELPRRLLRWLMTR